MSDSIEKSEAQSAESSKRRNKMGCCSAVVVIVLILTVAGVFVANRLRSDSIAMLKRAVGIVEGIENGFLNENITETFIANKMTVRGTKGAQLLVAQAESLETIEHRTEYQLAGFSVWGTERMVKVTVPATYRYQILLDDEWELSTEDDTVVVVAPEVRPIFPVAFDSKNLKYEAENGWLRWDSDSAESKRLTSKITGGLAKRAASAEALAEVRDESRLSVAHFVQEWLLKEEHWREGRFTAIKILFPDESNTHPDQFPATLTIESPLPPELGEEKELEPLE